MKKRFYKATSTVFKTLAFPGFAVVGNKNGSLELGLFLTMVGAPVTIPCALIFGIPFVYCTSKYEEYKNQ